MFSGLKLPSWLSGVNIVGNLNTEEPTLEAGNVLSGESIQARATAPRPRATPGPLQVPIVRAGIPDETNGTIELLGQNVTGAGWEDIFSFSFYLLPTNAFYSSPYYLGLNAYVKMVHTQDFQTTCGMIIYTNQSTLPYLHQAFPLERHPNLIFALVNWPYYRDDAGNVDRTILRTMRFHAVEHFPRAAVHMRDADSLFVLRIHKPYFNTLVSQWEAAYIHFTVPKIEKSGKQIVFGTYSLYRETKYHANLPYPVEFSTLVRMSEEKNNTKARPNPYKHLYVVSDRLTKENQDVLNNIDYKFVSGDPSTFKTLFRKPRESNSNFKERRKAAIEAAQEEYLKTIPENRRAVIPFYSFFKDTYMYEPPQGLYAGFVSVLKNRAGIEDFWLRCVLYLLERYRMVINPEDGKRTTSNDLIRVLRKLETPRFPWPTITGYAVGKDERMLLYGIVPPFVEKSFFFHIPYSSDPNLSYEPEFMQRSYVMNPKLDWNTTYSEKFQEHSESYRAWLEDFKRKFPTEEAFLDELNATIERRLVPKEALNEFFSAIQPHELKSVKLPAESSLFPYTMYETRGHRRITMRGGKRRLRKKNTRRK